MAAYLYRARTGRRDFEMPIPQGQLYRRQDRAGVCDVLFEISEKFVARAKPRRIADDRNDVQRRGYRLHMRSVNRRIDINPLAGMRFRSDDFHEIRFFFAVA